MVLLAVFIAGLMVGRTPEYLGKKIEAREVKLVADRDALPCRSACWSPPALAIATKYGAPSIYNSGPQGFSETLYAYTSQGNNNGSAFAGLHRLRPAERARQRGRVRDHVRRPARRRRDARRPLRAAAGGARGRRLAGHQAGRPGRRRARSAPTRRRSSCLLIGVIVHRRRAHVLPRPAARPGRPGPDHPALLTCAATCITIRHSPSSSSRCSSALAYPLATTGVAQVLFPTKADGSRDRAGRQGSSARGLIGQDFRGDAALLPVAPVGRPATTRRRHLLQQPRPEPAATLRDQLAAQPARLPQARAPLRPRAARGDVPVDAVTTSALGRRPPHLAGQRADPGAPRRAGAPAPPRPRAAAGRGQHRRPVARRARRARRERARAQPRPRREEPAMTAAVRARRCSAGADREPRPSSTRASRCATR